VRKRKRPKARPQADPFLSSPQWRQHLERLARPPYAQQARELHRRLQASPELQEAARRLMTSPLARPSDELIALMRRGPYLGDRQPAGKAESTPKSKSRKKGGGRKRALTTKEIKRLRGVYRALRRDKPKLKQSALFDALRKELDRHVSDTTLREWVAKPPTEISRGPRK
jgi:hypothetical protein